MASIRAWLRNTKRCFTRFILTVWRKCRLNKAYGINPNGRGFDVIVSKVMPSVDDLIGKARLK
jgi:hypothetical protein